MITLLSSVLFPGSLLSGFDVQFQDLVLSWFTVMIAVAIVCFAVSEITRNYSQVDKLWSLLPVAYSLITVAAFPSVRLYIMAALVTMWGFRLSYNFYRKGGYNIIPWKGEEDYRWKVLRENPALKGRFRFGLFNLFFISFYQNALIFLFSTPLLVAAANNVNALNIIDLIAALLMLLFIVTETLADNQLFRFQTEKKGLQEGTPVYRKSLANGFMSEGFWEHVRHPNFASEQAIWVSFYLFSVAASGKWLNFSIAGPLLLILLFIGSSAMTESISSGKYPEYKIYQKAVPKFIPRLFRRSDQK
jgi:steroid 5-alpha reductase family enzyme